jgi:hypothetical protein
MENEKPMAFAEGFRVVRERGLEPPLHCLEQNLNLERAALFSRRGRAMEQIRDAACVGHSCRNQLCLSYQDKKGR